MIRQNIPEIVRVLAEPLDAFDIYYMHNQEQILGLLYSKGYNQNDNEGIGGLEQYDNEAYHFSDYPGETMFYHLVMVKSAINPQTKLSWFLSKNKSQGNP